MSPSLCLFALCTNFFNSNNRSKWKYSSTPITRSMFVNICIRRCSGQCGKESTNVCNINITISFVVCDEDLFFVGFSLESFFNKKTLIIMKNVSTIQLCYSSFEKKIRKRICRAQEIVQSLELRKKPNIFGHDTINILMIFLFFTTRLLTKLSLNLLWWFHNVDSMRWGGTFSPHFKEEKVPPLLSSQWNEIPLKMEWGKVWIRVIFGQNFNQQSLSDISFVLISSTSCLNLPKIWLPYNSLRKLCYYCAHENSHEAKIWNNAFFGFL